MPHLGEMFLEHALNGRVWGTAGNADSAISPHGVYPCDGEDNWIAIAVETDEQWQVLCAVAGYQRFRPTGATLGPSLAPDSGTRLTRSSPAGQRAGSITT